MHNNQVGALNWTHSELNEGKCLALIHKKPSQGGKRFERYLDSALC